MNLNHDHLLCPTHPLPATSNSKYSAVHPLTWTSALGQVLGEGKNIPFSQVSFYQLWQPLCKPSAGAQETSWGATARLEQGQALAPAHEDTHLQAATVSGVTGRSAPKPKCRRLWQITCAINVSMLAVTSCYGWMWVGPLHTRNCVMETQKVGSKKGFAGY